MKIRKRALMLPVAAAMALAASLATARPAEAYPTCQLNCFNAYQRCLVLCSGESDCLACEWSFDSCIWAC